MTNAEHMRVKFRKILNMLRSFVVEIEGEAKDFKSHAEFAKWLLSVGVSPSRVARMCDFFVDNEETKSAQKLLLPLVRAEARSIARDNNQTTDNQAMAQNNGAQNNGAQPENGPPENGPPVSPSGREKQKLADRRWKAKRYADPDYRAKELAALRARRADPAYWAKELAADRARYADPEYRAARLAKRRARHAAKRNQQPSFERQTK